jgi:hypothetical protein
VRQRGDDWMKSGTLESGRVWDREGTIGRNLGLWSQGECETGSQGRWSHRWGDLETGTKSQDSGGWSGTQVGIGKENKLVLREGPWVKKIWISNFPFGDREILVNSWKRNVFNLFCELTRFLRVWPGFMRFWWFSSFASVSTRFMGFNS